jgi:predicted ATPase
LEQLNQLTTANYCRIYWQSILNLLGSASSPINFAGEAIEETTFMPQIAAAHDLFGLFLFWLYKLMLCYLFDSIELAQTMQWRLDNI